ncbi:MAG: F0F1 ATP synthase subunit A [Candidatus Zixiibacteriota bacterium]
MNLLLTEEIAKQAAERAKEGAPELPNFITLLYEKFGRVALVGFLHHWENVVFSWMIVIFVCVVAYLTYRKRSMMPGKLQNLVEMAVESLDNFVCGILGPQGRRFTPFLGTLFIYILCMNFLGLIPVMKSPTSSLNTTASLAICVFVYVQYTGIRNLGIVGYLSHMAGDPRDAVTWVLVPINIPIHVIGELAKPLSLSLRLFGNITGEDVLIAVFVGLGVSALGFLHLPVGIPFQLPFIFLALLTGTIQALVFTLLSTIYFSLMLPHHED